MDRSVTGSKSYGRGGMAVTVNSVFMRKPESDPYLFDSDEETGAAKTTQSTQPAKKKVKSRTSGSSAGRNTKASAGLSIDQKVKQLSANIVKNRGQSKNGDTQERHTFSSRLTRSGSRDVATVEPSGSSKSHNTRARLATESTKTGDQKKMASIESRYSVRNIKKKDLLSEQSKSTGSDSENAEPSSVPLTRSRSKSPQKSARSQSSVVSQLSTEDDMSQHSTHSSHHSYSSSKREPSRNPGASKTRLTDAYVMDVDDELPNVAKSKMKCKNTRTKAVKPDPYDVDMDDTLAIQPLLQRVTRQTSKSNPSSQESSPDRPHRSKKTSKTHTQSSGLSQEMEAIDLDNPPAPTTSLLNSKAPSMKHKLDVNAYNFSDDDDDDADADDFDRKMLKESDEEKIKIDFDKMEKRTLSKPFNKPIRRLLNSPKKSPAKYRYNHRSWLDDDEPSGDPASSSSSADTANHKLKLKHPLELKKVSNYPDKIGESITVSLKVRPEHKQLYTIVRNVRQAHECQDHGETQQIDDDLDFLLEGLEETEPASSRYLSAISLAKKCTNPTFRMHLRAQGSLSRIFNSLADATTDPRLALSATAIMFMLCQDRLNMDLDRGSLKLMVELLEYDDMAKLDIKKEKEEYEKSIDTVYSLYKSSLPAGEEVLDREELSPGYLAMECLLVLTSRRSGDWFKEELREVGAIISISNSIIDKTVEIMKTDYDMHLSDNVLVVLKKICRDLRVLEHVTAFNEGNQKHVIQHKKGEFVISLCRLLMYSVEALPTHYIDVNTKPADSGYLIFQMMLGVLRVLVNVTHNTASGCSCVNSYDGITEVLLKCILQTPQYVLEEQRFDMLVLGIGLLINMSEHSPSCRQALLDAETLSSYDSICEPETMTAIKALVSLFDQRLSAANKIEQETGHLKDSELAGSLYDDDAVNSQSAGDGNETLTEVLHKAGRHMEDTIVASYVALLLGVVVQHSPDYIDQVKGCLPHDSFDDVIQVLDKFLRFMKMTDAVSGNSGSKSIANVINFLKEYS